MPHQDKKISKFIAAINNDADIRRKSIEHEVENFNQKELEKAKNEALEEAYALIQRETGRIKSKISIEYAEKEIAQRKELIEKRNQITEKVFEDARKKLTEFATSSLYQDWLVQKVQAALPLFQDADDLQLLVCARDASLRAKLLSALQNRAELIVSNEIQLGGFCLSSPSSGKILDDTLESRLENQHDWFLENSGLTIQ